MTNATTADDDDRILLFPLLDRRRILFLSPHLDDLAFSCGGLLAADLGWRSFELVNVFGLSAWAPNLGVRDVRSISSARQAEDERFCSAHGIVTMNLGVPDSSCRGYTTAAECSADPSRDPLRERLYRTLHEVLRANSYDVLFCPLAIGNHVDHRLVFEAVRDWGQMKATVIFYEEIPYCAGIGLKTIDAIARDRTGARSMLIDIDIMAKLNGMCMYSTQVRAKDLEAAHVQALRRGSYVGFKEILWCRD